MFDLIEDTSELSCRVTALVVLLDRTFEVLGGYRDVRVFSRTDIRIGSICDHSIETARDPGPGHNPSHL